MQRHRLGRGDLNVSAICLGTMTYGEQNSEAEAHEQMDYALAQGIDFFDAAEMYPVPPKAETQGRTERYIGSWFKARGTRQQVVIATKVTGPGNFPYLRGGSHLDRASVLKACADSLRNLQTDVIDLYQVHWPERGVNSFGRLGYVHTDTAPPVSIEETLDALAELVKQGKVRQIGISNETPWGAAEYLRLSRERDLPRIASIQNPYSLLNRSFEIGLAEFAHREQLGLLAYSPLAMGALSGKYLDGRQPPKSRMSVFTRFTRYSGPRADAAVREYVSLAASQGLDPAQMALAYVQSRPFVAATIIGATTMTQLRSNIASAALKLDEATLQQIEAIHQQHTIPCP